MKPIKHKYLVLSGKGGVGKSTFTANLARAFAASEDTQVGVLDVDICGPSMPKVFQAESEQVHNSGTGWSPVVSACVCVYGRKGKSSGATAVVFCSLLG